MGRKAVIAGNWKINCTWASAVRLAQRISDCCDKKYPDIDIILCPPFTYIKGVANVFSFDRSDIQLGAQNVYEEMPEGIAAATGQVSVEMLKDLECSYCIVGHSECRQHNGESDELVARKVKLLLEHGIVPIICCGESLEVNKAGATLDFVSEQIRTALDGLSAADVAKSIIAYEPIWAIGTGEVPIPEKIDAVCAAIRGLVREMFGSDVAEAIRILYGGSLKPSNAHQILPLENVDGGLIGGASLDAEDFHDIVKSAKELMKR